MGIVEPNVTIPGSQGQLSNEGPKPAGTGATGTRNESLTSIIPHGGFLSHGGTPKSSILLAFSMK